MANVKFRVGEDRLTAALKAVGALHEDESIADLELIDGEIYITIGGEFDPARYLKRTGNWPLRL